MQPAQAKQLTLSSTGCTTLAPTTDYRHGTERCLPRRLVYGVLGVGGLADAGKSYERIMSCHGVADNPLITPDSLQEHTSGRAQRGTPRSARHFSACALSVTRLLLLIRGVDGRAAIAATARRSHNL